MAGVLRVTRREFLEMAGSAAALSLPLWYAEEYLAAQEAVLSVSSVLASNDARMTRWPLSFTAYPPGFVPYARSALLGSPSALDAASDAAAGEAWPREAAGPGGSPRWWSTQGRALRRYAHALGVFLAPKVQEVVALVAGAPLGLLVAASTADRRSVEPHRLRQEGVLS